MNVPCNSRGSRAHTGCHRARAGHSPSAGSSRVELHEALYVEDKAILRYTVTGTDSGPGGDFPPTGKPFTMPGVTIFRFDDGRIVEEWSVADLLDVSYNWDFV